MKKNEKINLLKSFLQTTATPQVQQQKQKSQIKQQMQYVEELNNCSCCGIEIDPTKKKKCGFCNMITCNDHMRKRRKKGGKWQKICDNCQDRILYDTHMKLESKAEQSLTVQQQITQLKHENFAKQSQDRQEKRQQMGFKTMKLKQKYQQDILKITDAQNKLMSKQHNLQSLQLSVQQIQVQVQRLDASFSQNCEEDWNILSQQNSRLAKELAKIQKKCMQIKISSQKKQKQIEDAFADWQLKQFKKKVQNEGKPSSNKKPKKDQCQIY